MAHPIVMSVFLLYWNHSIRRERARNKESTVALTLTSLITNMYNSSLYQGNEGFRENDKIL